MRVQRINPKTGKLPLLPKVQETKDVTVLWCDDGWSYIPELKIRRRFSEVEGAADHIVDYLEHGWEGLVPGKVLYDEKIKYTSYAGKKAWMEANRDYVEVFVIRD